MVSHPDEAQFRERVRQHLASHARPHGTAPRSTLIDDRELERGHQYQAALFDAGLSALTWPVEFGGQGLSNRHQEIFDEEVAAFDVPVAMFNVSFGMCMPTVLVHGTVDMKQQYLKPAARGDEVWCQLFSEPAAGSDLAAVRTKAVRDGDDWVINGQKVWTSGGHYSDFGLLLARTDPDVPKHKGMSMFVLDMHTPGVTVRPLRQMNGEAEFNEVFFDDVRVPSRLLLGGEGNGWSVALTTLSSERVIVGALAGGEGSDPIDAIAQHVGLARDRGKLADPIVRQGLADLYIRYRVLDLVEVRARSIAAAGGTPGPEGSIAKLSGAAISRMAADLACTLAGLSAVAWDDSCTDGAIPSQLLLSSPAMGIGGGTNEIQRNILGERVLGLPKEPSVDKNVPFRTSAIAAART